MSINALRQTLQSHADPLRAQKMQRFFKTGVGEYGEGDVFFGVSVPQLRKLARQWYDKLSAEEIESLLYTPIHEQRLLALLIWVLQFQKGDAHLKQKVYDAYTKHMAQVNNWDLVDSSASYIVGAYLYKRERAVLHTWVTSHNLWKRRIAIVATHYFIRQKDFDTTLSLAAALLGDRHDLIHKATGWMLREVGKQDEAVLRGFLDAHADVMPRTMLRYALERLEEPVRRHYMRLARLKPRT